MNPSAKMLLGWWMIGNGWGMGDEAPPGGIDSPPVAIRIKRATLCLTKAVFQDWGSEFRSGFPANQPEHQPERQNSPAGDPSE